ncbi:MAG: molybdopterin-binding protein [Paracoccaceae bacterium]|nr:molybdopterin-binding protein [Paracoccaceae bacterium]
MRPPRLRNDCFALPAGVDWVPVDDALNILRDQLSSVVGTEILPLSAAIGRVLAVEAVALRASPPGPNSAVDGYGVAHAVVVEGDNVLPLAEGRSAAGVPFAGKVPHGQALRILTGALLPDGVDTVILQEDVALRQGHLAFEGPMRIGANTRRAGEDVDAGQIVLAAGSVLTPQGAALLASVGCSDVKVYRPLRVGVLSTGDEIAAPGSTLSPEKTYDANKPMLLGIIEAWGYRAVDLGHVPDDPGLLRARLDEASNVVDVIFTSGGASAGDEDHISTVLEQAGALSTWRIAIKPGRPLALGLWQGVPVFGLPGNPVAAFVCTLLFGRPALSVMAGSDWCAPVGYNLPAAFEKDKKPGRAEYLRARLDAEGQVEIFKSEGSGRISGLNWATGLVELGVEARKICRGDPVRFIPFGSFGLPT